MYYYSWCHLQLYSLWHRLAVEMSTACSLSLQEGWTPLSNLKLERSQSNRPLGRAGAWAVRAVRQYNTKEEASMMIFSSSDHKAPTNRAQRRGLGPEMSRLSAGGVGSIASTPEHA